MKSENKKMINKKKADTQQLDRQKNKPIGSCTDRCIQTFVDNKRLLIIYKNQK